MSEIVPPWTRRPCDECGCEHLATRGEALPAPLLCEGCEMYARGREEAMAERDALRVEVERLNGLINTPHTDDFMRAVPIEAAHQRVRWGEAKDGDLREMDRVEGSR